MVLACIIVYVLIGIIGAAVAFVVLDYDLDATSYYSGNDPTEVLMAAAFWPLTLAFAIGWAICWGIWWIIKALWRALKKGRNDG